MLSFFTQHWIGWIKLETNTSNCTPISQVQRDFHRFAIKNINTRMSTDCINSTARSKPPQTNVRDSNKSIKWEQNAKKNQQIT